MLTSFGGIKLFNFVCLNFDDFFEYCPVSIVRGHPYKLYKKRCNSNVRKKNLFFQQRILCHLLLILVPYIVLSVLEYRSTSQSLCVFS